MGAADIIPGVSGGTVALITGIYERLIDAIKSVNLLFVPYFFRGFVDRKYFTKTKENFLGIDFKLLLPLIAGVGVAFLLIANVIGHLFDNYETYTYAFFFGLILSSSFLVFRTIEKLTISAPFFVLIGFLSGFFIVGLEAIQTTNSLPIIFFSGVITLCAMILPGISGAFILLLLGQYRFMLGILRGFIRGDFTGLPFAITYIVGGVIGILVLSRFLSYLIKNYRAATLSFLTGLMIGALREPTELIIGKPENITITVISAIFGICIVSLFGYYKLYMNKQSTSLS